MIKMNCCQSPVTISMWNNFINKKGRSLKERKVFPVRKNKHTKNRACGGWNFSLCLTHSGECPYSNFFFLSRNSWMAIFIPCSNIIFHTFLFVRRQFVKKICLVAISLCCSLSFIIINLVTVICTIKWC